MNYYPFHIGDYAAHTQRLSLMEDLAYRRLIDAYYLAERPLNGCPADVAREIGMQDQLDAVTYVLNKFFSVTEDGYRNERCDKEIAHYQDKQAKASSAGKASAQRRSNGRSTDVGTKATDVGKSSTDVQLTNNQEPITNTEDKSSVDAKPKTARRKTQFPPDFYPNETGEAAAASKGISIPTELERFRDYHLSRGNLMADWQAAWRTWVGNARPSFTPIRESFSERDERRARERIAEFTGASSAPAFDIIDEARRIA